MDISGLENFNHYLQPLHSKKCRATAITVTLAAEEDDHYIAIIEIDMGKRQARLHNDTLLFKGAIVDATLNWKYVKIILDRARDISSSDNLHCTTATFICSIL
jgi:hypothetical protein